MSSYYGRSLDNISNVEKLDNITFDGSTSYALTKSSAAFTPAGKNNILISVSGVIQQGNFSVSGSNIVFDSAVASTESCDFIMHYGTGLITTPADATVTDAKIVDMAASKLTGTVAQANIADQAINEAKMQVSNSPVNGYMLTAQSGNTGGLTWAEAGSGALNLVNAYTSSSQIGNVSFDNVFSSTYRNYMVVGDLTNVTSGATIEMRFRNGGSDEGGNNYSQYLTRYKIDTDDRYKHRTSSVNSFRTGTGLNNNVTNVSWSFKMMFFDPNNSSTWTKMYLTSVFVDNDGYSGQLNGMLTFSNATALDGFKLFPSSGNLYNATIRIYGLSDS